VPPPRIPLADQADRMLDALAEATGSPVIAELHGQTLLGERAMLGGFRIGGRVSPGGGCRLYDTADGVVALNLARVDDRELLPALFESELLDPADDADIAAHMIRSRATTLVARGRPMGLAIAREGESGHGDAVTMIVAAPATPPPRRTPRVLDLSALWAGPLAAHLLWLAGAAVTKAESMTRPDAMRADETGFFALLDQDKRQVAFDANTLPSLIAKADIVIEAARPRALLQLGVNADAIVQARPGLVWLSITAHGIEGDAANWVGFGDDIGVAAGLSAALRAASGDSGFVGDAIADPLSGIRAALVGWQAWRSGTGGRYVLSVRDVVAECLRDAGDLGDILRAWHAARGQPFPEVARRC
jgi:hypothetical protein